MGGGGVSARRWPLGVCELAWRGVPRAERARQARAAGFDHLDLVSPLDPEDELALPVGVVLGSGPHDGWAWPAPRPNVATGRAIAALRRAKRPRIEPWAGSLFGSDAAVADLLEQVPELRLVVDVGHVAQWGGDPLRFLEHADLVQLRQGARGRGQLPPAEGDVDFAALLGRLRAIGYDGRLTIEYFDLPRAGWPLEDPFGACVALAAHIAPLLDRP